MTQNVQMQFRCFFSSFFCFTIIITWLVEVRANTQMHTTISRVENVRP